MSTWKSYHFKCPVLYGNAFIQFYKYVKAFLLAQGWEKFDEWGGQAARWTISGNNWLQNNETVTIDGVVYTFITTLTPAVGEVLIGANLTASYANLKLAINRTDPGTNDGVKYKIAAAHPLWEATTATSTSLTIDWRAGVGSCAGNTGVMTETAQYQAWSSLTLWGVDPQTVWRSNGESGLEPYGYIFITPNLASDALRFMAYQYWNATTHTGTRAASTVDYFYFSSIVATTEYIVEGDKDMIYLNCAAPARDNYQGWMISFGHLPKRFMPDLILTTDAIVAGNNVSIPVTDSSKVSSTGGYFQILGVAGEGCDKLQVASIPDATHIVVVTLPRNYASGATIGLPASTFWINNSYINAGYQVPFPVSYFSDAGLTVGVGRFTFTAIEMRSMNLFYGKRVMTPMFCMTDTLAAIGWIDKGMFYYSGASAWDVACANLDGSVIVTNILATSATSLSITDSTKSWTPGALVGKYIVLVGGTGIGQVRKITVNDATSLTINYAWYTTPDATTTFRIYDSVYRYLSNTPWTTTAHLVTHTELPPAS